MTADDNNRRFYRWRRMTDAQRDAVVAWRRQHRLAWHSPPHFTSDSQTYLVTSACYEHQQIIGRSHDRLATFSEALVKTCNEHQWNLYAWVVLPNHYHFLARSGDAKQMIVALGRLHGKTSYQWNREECCAGRKVW